MWTAVPLLSAPVAVYVVLAAAMLPRGLKGDAAAALARPLLTVSTPSGALWPVSAGDALVLGALAILFAELLKSTDRRDVAIVNHSLSMILLGLCLMAFLFAPACATSAFFLVTVMVALDVVAGFIATFAATRRDQGR